MSVKISPFIILIDAHDRLWHDRTIPLSIRDENCKRINRIMLYLGWVKIMSVEFDFPLVDNTRGITIVNKPFGDGLRVWELHYCDELYKAVLKYADDGVVIMTINFASPRIFS